MTTLQEAWEELPIWLSATQAMGFLNVSRQTLSQYLEDGKLVYWRGETANGNKGPYRISKDSIGEFCGLTRGAASKASEERA